MIKEIKSFLLLVFLSFNSIVLAQENDYIYHAQYLLEFKTNSNNKKYHKEYFELFFNQSESLFLSSRIYDSFTLENFQENVNMKKIARTSSIFKEIILNKLGQTECYINKDSHYYKYQESSPKWILIEEKKKIGKLLCKKAVTNFIGRQWIVWYTDDYSFPFGAFKFNGLPGLIVDVMDSDETYHYSLVNIKKNP